MESTQIINHLIRIDNLINRQATGNAKELSDKLGVSERSIYNYLNLMKNFGAPIYYSISRHSYFYKTTGKFHIGFVDPLEIEKFLQ
jgi:predicted DNA-binding transcriptional regulator YafY